MSKKYFDDLNYTLGNEDTTLEVEIIKRLKPKSIFSIAGCGSRALPLLQEGVESLVMADISPYQILISKLRYQTILQLDYHSFLTFWGFPPYGGYDYSHRRREIFYSLKLESDVFNYFQDVFKEIKWDGLLYIGRWERTFQTLAKINRSILGKDFSKIFEFFNISDQARYFENDFPLKRWKSVLFMLGNKALFNALLYKGNFIKKNVSGSYLSYYSEAFDHLMSEQLARESFFMNLCFFGKINHSDANPIEAKEEVFESMKTVGSQANVDFLQMDLLRAIGEGQKFDFVSLSDVPSYFSGDLEKNYLQEIKKGLNPKACVVLRSYLRVPEHDESGYADITPQFGQEIFEEKVQMYQIKVLQLI